MARTIPKRSVQAFFRRLEKGGQVEFVDGGKALVDDFREFVANARRRVDGAAFGRWLVEQDAVEDVFASDDELQRSLESLAAAPADDAPPTIASNPELEAAIVARPHDRGAYMVYGDWLQEQGDHLGTLISLAGRAEAGDGKAEREFGRWLKKHELLGRVASYVPRQIKLQWEHGFVRSAVLGSPRATGALETRIITELLLDLRVCRFLRELTVHPFAPRTNGDEILLAIAGRKLPVLESLKVVGFDRIESVSALGALPRLRELEIRLDKRGVLRLDGIPNTIESLSLAANVVQPATPELAAANMQRLHVEVPRPSSVAAWLGSGEFPRLTDLSLAAGVADFGTRDFTRWLDRDPAPALDRLEVRGSQNTGVLAKHVLGSQWSRSLTRLALTEGDLTGPDFSAIGATVVEARPTVTELDLRDNAIPAELASTVTRPGLTVHIDEPRAPGAPTVSAIRMLAPDSGCLERGRAIAKPAGWPELGRDEHGTWWGIYRKKREYRVRLSADLGRHVCECPSPDNPCKHIVALGLLACEHEFAAAAVPASFEGLRRQRFDAVRE